MSNCQFLTLNPLSTSSHMKAALKMIAHCNLPANELSIEELIEIINARIATQQDYFDAKKSFDYCHFSEEEIAQAKNALGIAI